MLSNLVFKTQRPIVVSSQRFRRDPFGDPKRSSDERNRLVLNRHKGKKLNLSDRSDYPDQWKSRQSDLRYKVETKERKLESLANSLPPYEKYTTEAIEAIEKFETFYDPNFNPHLHEQRHRVNPEEEPFNAIYADAAHTEAGQEFTKVRNIATPELWSYVERLAKVKVPPVPRYRKASEPITPLPSGYVPPAETPPDLPYFVARTRNYVLPVYYHLGKSPDECYTCVSRLRGDLWQFESDLRSHLESIRSERDVEIPKILTAVWETDAQVHFKGRHLNEIVNWMYSKGF